MSERRAKLTAGQGWTEYLSGQGRRTVTADRRTIFNDPPEKIVGILNKRIEAMRKAMQDSDMRAAQTGLSDTVRMLSKARHLPGDAQRRTDVTTVVAWLTEQTPNRR